MKSIKKALSVLLVFCLTLGLFPALGQSAMAASGAMTGEQLLATAVGGTITVSGNIILTTPLTIATGQTITLKGSGTILPGPAFISLPASGGQYNSLIYTNGGTLIVQKGVTLDGDNHSRVIEAIDNAKVSLQGCIIKNGRLLASQHGAGVYLTAGSTMEASGNTQFIKNQSDENSATCGGAVYVSGATATFDDVIFADNKANSGGALYVYRGSATCTENTVFENNAASQRGGAIHDHGTVKLSGTNRITGNESGQYGGAIYVSASKERDCCRWLAGYL